MTPPGDALVSRRIITAADMALMAWLDRDGPPPSPEEWSALRAHRKRELGATIDCADDALPAPLPRLRMPFGVPHELRVGAF